MKSFDTNTRTVFSIWNKNTEVASIIKQKSNDVSPILVDQTILTSSIVLDDFTKVDTSYDTFIGTFNPIPPNTTLSLNYTCFYEKSFTLDEHFLPFVEFNCGFSIKESPTETLHLWHDRVVADFLPPHTQRLYYEPIYGSLDPCWFRETAIGIKPEKWRVILRFSVLRIISAAFTQQILIRVKTVIKIPNSWKTITNFTSI